MTYSELFRLVVIHIYDEYRKEDILSTKKLSEELSLNKKDFHLNLKISMSSDNSDDSWRFTLTFLSTCCQLSIYATDHRIARIISL